MPGGVDISTEQKTVAGGGWKRRLPLFFALAVVAALAYLWSQRDKAFQWSLFLKTLAAVDWLWLSVAAVLIAVTYIGRVIRWRLMMRPVCPHPHFGNLLEATIIGFTAIVLFGRAGELVRPYLIAQREKVSFSSQLAAWLLERIYDLLSVLVLFGFALSRISSSSTKVGPTVQMILQVGGHMVGVLCALCLAVLAVFGLFPEFAENRILAVIQVLPARVAGRLTNFARAFVAGTGSTRRFSFVFLLVLYTFAEWLLITFCFLSLFRAFPATAGLGFTDTLIVVGFVAFGSAIQIPGVGGGMQVATILILTELFGIPLEVATGVAILIWILTFVMVVPFGLVLVVRGGLEWRKLMDNKSLEAE